MLSSLTTFDLVIKKQQALISKNMQNCQQHYFQFALKTNNIVKAPRLKANTEMLRFTKKSLRKQMENEN